MFWQSSADGDRGGLWNVGSWMIAREDLVHISWPVRTSAEATGIVRTSGLQEGIMLLCYIDRFSFIHSIGMCRILQFLAVLRSFFHSFLLCTFSFHPSPPTSLPSSLTSFCHLFLGLPLSLIVSKFIYNTLLGILFPSILCTCPNQHNLFNLIVSVIIHFLILCKFLYWLISSNFFFIVIYWA